MKRRIVAIVLLLFLTDFAKTQTVIGPCVGGQCPSPAICLRASNQCVIFIITTTIAPSTCVDKAAPGRLSDCPQNRNLCTNPLYAPLMREQCPRTCGYCTGGSSSTCVDLAAPGKLSTCPGQKNLCTNSLYRDLMRQQCPKTCGYCR